MDEEIAGVAYSIHNAFKGADMPAVAEILFHAAPAAAPISGGDDVYRIMRDQLLPRVENAAEQEGIRGKLDEIRSRLAVNSISADKLIAGTEINERAMYAQALDYVGRQPPQFVAQYLDLYTRECTEAYKAGNGSTTLSCAKGMLERVIVGLGLAGFGMESDEYVKLSEALVFQVNDTVLYGLISDCLNKNENVKRELLALPDSEDMPEKTEVVMKCMFHALVDKYPKRYAIDRTLPTPLLARMKYTILQSREMLTADSLEGGGGRARPSTRKKKKTTTRARRQSSRPSRPSSRAAAKKSSRGGARTGAKIKRKAAAAAKRRRETRRRRRSGGLTRG